ncbi:unnamed protein product [Urochloa humidicola]
MILPREQGLSLALDPMIWEAALVAPLDSVGRVQEDGLVTTGPSLSDREAQPDARADEPSVASSEANGEGLYDVPLRLGSPRVLLADQAVTQVAAQFEAVVAICAADIATSPKSSGAATPGEPSNKKKREASQEIQAEMLQAGLASTKCADEKAWHFLDNRSHRCQCLSALPGGLHFLTFTLAM